jgi:ArsR family transcriptional regulator, arsenate/arsenite/antimonite-responsive transcriptional repressor
VTIPSRITEHADVQALADLFKVLSEPKRLRILNLIMEGKQCNCEIGEALGVAPNLVSHHLGILQAAGLVNAERDAVDARWIYYSINRDVLDAYMASIASFLDSARIQPRLSVCGPQGAAGTCASRVRSA